MRNFLKTKRHYKNLIFYYNNLFIKRKINYKMIQKQTCDIKFPIFLNKVTPFKLRGVIIRRHKKNINSTVTVGSYVSNVKLIITYPLAYNIVKIN